jgi:MFS family permease
METTQRATAPAVAGGGVHRPVAQLALVAIVEVLVLAVWFSASVVVPALRSEWGLSQEGAIWLTATVQLGFALGAVASSLLNLADRVRPERLIAVCAVVCAAATLAVALLAGGLWTAIPLRLATGVGLAGVYPTGMKLTVSWFPRARGLALGVLLAALALGSAVPQLLNAVSVLPWRGVLAAAAALALAGGVLAAALLRAGPHAAPSPPLEPRYVVSMFRDRRQRLVNVGYFGHMWELYGLWTWMPTYVAASYAASSPVPPSRSAIGLTAFAAIGVAGAAGCVAAGHLADRVGRARVAMTAMLASAACCALSPAFFGGVRALFVVLLLVWGAAVIADSAQFSAALTEAADRRYVGTALTAQTAIGFTLSVVTIQALPALADVVGWRAAVPLLCAGPLVGAAAMRRLAAMLRASAAA